MKTITILVCLLVAQTFSLFGQGKINIANDSIRLFTHDGFVYAADAAYANQPTPATPLPSGTILTYLLYAGTTSGSLALQNTVPLSGSNLTAPGRIAPKGVILSIPGGVPQYFQAFVYGSASPALPPPSTISSAFDVQFQVNAFYFGTSGLFTFTPGTSVTYPLLYTGDSTWAAEPLVIRGAPEPTTCSLLGIASALILRRRLV